MEIYNEVVYDLLSKTDEINQPLQLFEDTDEKKFLVKGKTMIKVETLEEAE